MNPSSDFNDRDLKKLIQDMLNDRGQSSFRVGSVNKRNNAFGEGNWYEVELWTHSDTAMHRFMEAFSDIEQTIDEKYHIDVFLTPEIISE